MSLKAAIFAVLMGLPVHPDDAGEPLRFERMDAVAEDISEVAESRPAGWEPVDVAAMLVTLGYKESSFAKYVGDGCLRIPKGHAHCDHGKARSYWQAWKVACPKAWEFPVGSRDSQKAFAKCAAQRWLGAYYRCRNAAYPKDPVAGAFAGYRSGCRTWAPAVLRARLWATMKVRILAKLSG